MPVQITANGKKSYEGNDRNHAEEVMFNSGKYDSGTLNVEMDAWPCTGERGHNCHALFIRKSAGRKITLTITSDHGGYAANHGKTMGSTGTITYDNGSVTYS